MENGCGQQSYLHGVIDAAHFFYFPQLKSLNDVFENVKIARDSIVSLFFLSPLLFSRFCAFLATVFVPVFMSLSNTKLFP